MFAPASVRTRKIDSGISGFATRASQTTKKTISAPAAISRTIVVTSLQPSTGAFEIA